MSRRIDSEILQRTYDENIQEFTSEPLQSTFLPKFEALRHELRHADVTPLRHLHPPPPDSSSEVQEEYQQWHAILSEYVTRKDTWLSAPWLVAEFYLYRRLMEALDYFCPSSPGYLYDPFAYAKRKGLETSVSSAEIGVMSKLPSLPHTPEGMKLASAFALWGNKMDLSIWPADDNDKAKHVFNDILSKASENLLHDDTLQLTQTLSKLQQKGGGKIHIIVDNAGFELVTDLALADYLLQSKCAHTIVFELKSHPTFVSDALEKDLMETIEYYANTIILHSTTTTNKSTTTYPFSMEAGKRWQSYIQNGQWICREDNFWVQPNPMWEMPSPLFDDLNESCDLAFVKGDANYRRLLGDRSWDLTNDSFQDVVGHYFPCPVCALRTLKAEIGCGMGVDQVEKARLLDPDDWMVNGRFGVVHYGTGCGTLTET